ncbi:MAG: T9SS type A sorting domain-containing protein [Ferruginibacter sp.]
MTKCYKILLAVIIICSSQGAIAQSVCNGLKGPNVLGAKGTFSPPYITVNTAAASCTNSGSNSYNPLGNVGNAISDCATPGLLVPCTDYTYTAENSSATTGLTPPFRYSILKTIGDNNGGNCMKGDWRGRDHTGDGGYFMAVNGDNNTLKPIFYQIKSIPVCIGAIYEFSAWVINLLPGTVGSGNAPIGSEPSISFKVNGTVIANSGPIAYSTQPGWVKVAGSFTATTPVVDLQVVNATSSFLGNDLGLDDISFNVCESKIAVSGPASSTICNGNTVSVDFTVTDINHLRSWYKWQLSTDGGANFTDLTSGAQAAFVGDSYTLTYNIGTVTPAMNGYKYRLGVSTSQVALSTPECIYFNDYSLLIGGCGALPVQLTSFNGRYDAGKAILDWQTSQEINSDHFELLRSTDGQEFNKIATIAATGNSNSTKNYSYQDNVSSSSGNSVFYRLKQVDKDGRVTFASIVKLSLGSKLTFDIFPNPFTNNFTVSFGALKTSIATLSIQNSTGSLVYTKAINVTKGNNLVVMSNLPTLGKGIYYVTVYNDEFKFNGKLQKQ